MNSNVPVYSAGKIIFYYQCHYLSILTAYQQVYAENMPGFTTVTNYLADFVISMVQALHDVAYLNQVTLDAVDIRRCRHQMTQLLYCCMCQVAVQ